MRHWLVAIVLLAACSSPTEKSAAGARVLSDTGGPIDIAVTVISSPRRSALRNQNMIDTILKTVAPGARILILADAEMILDPNPWPGRMEFVRIPEGTTFTIWPQDPFVVLSGDDRGPRLLASRDYGRAEDREMTALIGRALGWPLEPSDLFFSGGNVLADERGAFVGRRLIEENATDLSISRAEVLTRFVTELGRPVVVVEPQPVAHIDLVLTPLGDGRVAVADAGEGARLAEAALAERPEQVAAFEAFAESYFFGHPEVESMEREDGGVLERPPMAGETARAIEDSRAIAAGLDAMAQTLEARGYEIVRIPTLSRREVEQERVRGGHAGYPFLSYNNVLVERRDGRDLVYLPRYGFPTLDEAARNAWAAAGFNIVPVDGLTTSAMYRGSLRCMVKVLRR